MKHAARQGTWYMPSFMTGVGPLSRGLEGGGGKTRGKGQGLQLLRTLRLDVGVEKLDWRFSEE